MHGVILKLSNKHWRGKMSR